ncbi:Tissue factor pathway inhibitor 2 [Bulinus truncatus]|nr:Tissue factor pathway inhibitor 2 [Bulinus truncatus]
MADKLIPVLIIIILIANVIVMKAEPPTCYQPPNDGTCSKFVINYYYDNHLKTCRQFKYTGCGGNDNRFKDEESCKKRCEGLSGYF